MERILEISSIVLLIIVVIFSIYCLVTLIRRGKYGFPFFISILTLIFSLGVLYSLIKKNFFYKKVKENVVTETEEIPVEEVEDEERHEIEEINSSDVKINFNNGKWREEKKNYLQKLTEKVNDPIFITKYTESVRVSLKIKRAQYNNILLRLPARKSGKEGIHGIFEEIRKKDDTKMLARMLADEIAVLIEAIDARLSSLNEKAIKEDLETILYSKEGFQRLKEREDVKEHLSRQILSFAESPRTFMDHFQNIVLYGKPGVGKTTCANVISFVYLKSGMLARNKLLEATKSDFNSSYVEDTSINTRKILIQHLEGIVFLDEAYEITPKNIDLGITHGTQAITEICDFLSKWKGKIVFIAGGYEEEMHRFLNVNQGMDRRFPFKLFLGDYSATALSQVFGRSIPKSVPLNTSLLYSLVEFGITNKAFPYQAGDIGNIASSYLTMYHASKDEPSDNHLINSFKEYYRKNLGKDIKVTK